MSGRAIAAEIAALGAGLARPSDRRRAARAVHLVSRRRAGARFCSRRPTRTTSPICWRICRAEIPVTVIGLGSNLIMRDGGIRGVVIRLGGKAFGAVETTPDRRVIAGAAALDAQVARAAAEAGIDGLAFLRGVPGSIGGALRMNAGAHGGETRDMPDRGARDRSRRRAARLRQRRDGLFLSPQRSARGRDLHPRRVSGPPRRPRRDPGRNGAHHRARAKLRSRSARRPAARPSRIRRARRPGN